MFERYTEQAKRSLFFARYESSQLGSPSIEPEHLLLGVLRESAAVADLLPADTLDALREEMRQKIGMRPPIPTTVEIPFAPDAKRVLQAAAQEADSLTHEHIGAEHLLLALAATAGTNAEAALSTRGVHATELRELIGERGRPPIERPPDSTR